MKKKTENSRKECNNGIPKLGLTIPPCSADLRALVRPSVGNHGGCDVEGVDEVFPYGKIEVEDGLVLCHAVVFDLLPCTSA